MRALVFDAGPLISLTMNNLLWIMEPLKTRYNGAFYLAKGIEIELVDKPLRTKKFKFEALQTLHYIENKTFDVIESRETEAMAQKLLEMANNIFYAREEPIRIVHYGEMAAMAVAIEKKAEALAVDERTTRLLIENPELLHRILEKKLHTKISINKPILKAFSSIAKGLKVIRSAELVVAAYELGLLDKYLPSLKDAKEELLDAVLWGVKIDGCAVSVRDIERIKKIER